MALSTTTILARLMPFGAPSTPSAKGRLCPFVEPSVNGRYFGAKETAGVRSKGSAFEPPTFRDQSDRRPPSAISRRSFVNVHWLAPKRVA